MLWLLTFDHLRDNWHIVALFKCHPGCRQVHIDFIHFRLFKLSQIRFIRVSFLCRQKVLRVRGNGKMEMMILDSLIVEGYSL